MIKPNKNIKKLSTAMLRGLKIGKERGIKRITGALIRTDQDGRICGACALGFALIGLYGEDAKDHVSYSNLPGTKEPNLCLPKQFGKKVRERIEPKQGWYTDLHTQVYSLNDVSKKPVEEIANALKACKL